MTTTIKNLQDMPAGQGTGGYTFSIKTAKKKWSVKDVWWQQVIVMDETGEMPADVKIGKNIPLVSGGQISIIVAYVHNAEYLGKDRKKLVVDQFTIPTQTVDDYYKEVDEIYAKELKVVKSKIKCLLTAGLSPKIEYDYQTHQFSPPPGLLLDWLVEFTDDERLVKVINNIVGE